MGDESKETNVALVNVKLPDFANNAAKNLTDKPTQSIGQTLADLWQLALGGRVSLAVEKQKLKYAHALEEYKKELEEKVTAIPEEKQTEPPLQIAAQALDDSQYCVESEKLRNMFSSLIANSMNIDYTTKIHPSFSKIIQQMSPMDAQMLEIFRKRQVYGGIAIVNYIKQSNDSGFEMLAEFIPEVTPAGCSLKAAARSIISLQRLGLVQIPEDGYFVDEKLYTVFYRTSLYAALKRQIAGTNGKIEIEKHLAKLTILGKDFVSVCLD